MRLDCRSVRRPNARMDLQIQGFTDTAVRPHLQALAELRIGVFREWPYLYEGSLEYEARYLESYLAPRALVVLALDGHRVVGASTALPLSAHQDAASPVLSAAGYDPDGIYYFGESVLLPEYRGRGVGRRFFEEREQAARRFGYALAAFAAVERPQSHPLCPADYVGHESLWTKRGFVKHPELVTTFSWKDIGQDVETQKPMVFWLKTMSAATV